MAGDTNSEVILAALNQQVQAINDLITAVGALVLQVEVASALPDVNVTCTPSVVVNVSCTGEQGSVVESGNGDQGQTPPTGYTAPDPETTDRKCRVANLIHDSMVALVDELAIMDVDQYAAVGFVVTMGIVGAALGSALPVAGTVIGAVAGIVSGIAIQLVTGGVALDLTDLGTLLSNNQDALVQSLYNATSADDARSAYTAILTAQGATVVEAGLISLALPNDLTNLLFFTREDLEPQIAEYTGTVDCVLAVVDAWHWDAGCEGWEWLDLSDAPNVCTGVWSTDGTPDPSDPSVGHLRTSQSATANPTGKWTYTYETLPTVGEDTVFQVDVNIGVTAASRVRAYLYFSDDTYLAAEREALGWGAIIIPLEPQPTFWGKSLDHIVFLVDKYSGALTANTIDFDNASLVGYS